MARLVPIPSAVTTAALAADVSRPFFGDAVDLYVGNGIGNDANDGLTALTALQTIPAALKLAAINGVGNVNINFVQDGDSFEEYDFPATLPLLNRLTFVGEFHSTQTYSLEVDTVIESDDEEGIVLDVTGVGVGGVLADALIGMHVIFPNANNRVGTVKRNDATLPGDLTRIYVSQGPTTNDNAATDTTQVGDVLTLWTRLATLKINAATHSVIEASTSCVFKNLNFTGTTNGAVLYVLASDKVDFQNCHFSAMRQVRAGFGGHVFFSNGWGACVGLESEGGMFVAVNGGSMLFRRGFVISGTNAGAGAKFCSAFQGGSFRFRNLTHVRGCENPFRIFGSKTEPDTGIGPEDGIYFDDDCTGDAFTFNDTQTWAAGAGGQHYLPHLHGEISGYAVVAQLDAYVYIPSGSTIITDGGTSVVGVNCDGATAERAWSNDGAKIFGGFPARPPIKIGTFSQFQSAGTYQAIVGEVCVYTAASLTGIDAPAPGVDLISGDQWGIKNSSNSATSITLDGNGSDIENFQSAPGTYSATTSAAGAGIAAIFTYDGDDFVEGVG